MNAETFGPADDSPGDRGVRLQKVLAEAGVGSRRRCEELIAAGRVSVGGEVVTRLGTRIDPANAVVHVDGERLVVAPDVRVLALNKPRGVVTAMSDQRGRPCVGDLIADLDPAAGRLFHVGRLDADTEGLLLLTNDGDLAHRLTHPSFGVEKTYVAEVRPAFDRADLRRLRGGVPVDDRTLVVGEAKLMSTSGDRSLVRLTIHEGRNRIVRRAFEVLGFQVASLARTKFGPIELGSLPPGSTRRLDPPDLDRLYGSVEAGPGLRTM